MEELSKPKKFNENHPDIQIIWEKRSLQAFADRPIELMAFDYDLMVIDHPHVGEASRKDLIYELNKSEKFEDQTEDAGTSETEDNLTSNSPGPLKPGAFVLADQLKPEPLLIPIALANFDYSISDTIYSAVIKEPIKIKHFVKDIKNKKELEELIKNQLHDMDSTQYEDLDENIAYHSNEGLKSSKSRSHKRRFFKLS